MSRPARRRRAPWPLAALAACAAAGWSGEQLVLDAPSQYLRLEPDGAVTVARRGFVARWGQNVLSGEALRWEQGAGNLWATGDLVLLMPKIRLHAARIGLRGLRGGGLRLGEVAGEAWEVEAFVEAGPRTLRLRAERIELADRVITFHDVTADAGHGGAVSLWCPTIRIHLRDHAETSKEGFRREVAGIEAVSPTGRVVGIPVLWFPWAYRDFVLDYPWTQLRAGSSRRLGRWARYWIGSDLPEVAGWRTRLVGRVDRHTRTGNAWGLSGRWRHDAWGRGSASLYEFPKEQVPDAANERDGVTTRRARSIDAEHRMGSGGLALAGRWTVLPPADPRPGDSGDPRVPDERFRADYLKDDLERKPFARRGLAGAWSTALGTLTIDSERRPQDDLRRTERWLGVQADLAPLHMIGPLHAGARAWSEDLRKPRDDTRAVRTRYDLGASLGQWSGGAGIEGRAGISGIEYRQGRLDGADLDPLLMRRCAVLEGIGRLRFAATFDDLLHTVTPRAGAEARGPGVGDALPAFAFGDPRDTFAEDERYWVLGLNTALVRERTLLTADVKSRWAMRRLDRRYLGDDGDWRTGPHRLADVTASAEGSPVASLTLTAAFTYDARPRRWTAFDGSARWTVDRHLELRHLATLVPRDARVERWRDEWQQRPGASFTAERYRFDGDLTFKQAGRQVDGWHAQVTRHMVDGDLFAGWELVYDRAGKLQDQRVSIGFSFAGTPDPADDETGLPGAKADFAIR